METTENSAIVKRLSKYTSDQLLKKYESKTFSSSEEESVVKSLLIKRGKLEAEIATEKVLESPELTLIKVLAQKSADGVMILTPIDSVTTTKELSISEIVDAIYEMNDKDINAKLCSFFPEEFEEYSDLPQETQSAIREFYNSLVNPQTKVEQPKAIKPIKAKKEKVELVKEEVKEVKVKTDSGNITLEKSEKGIKAEDTVSFLLKDGTVQLAKVCRVLLEASSNKEQARLKSADGKVFIKYCKSLTLVK